MPEYVTVNKVRIKATDAILDYLLRLRNERAEYLWVREYVTLLAVEMVKASDADRVNIAHEMLSVLRKKR